MRIDGVRRQTIMVSGRDGSRRDRRWSGRWRWRVVVRCCFLVYSIRMGSEGSVPTPKNEEIKTTHPWQQKSKMVWQGDQEYIQSSFGTSEERYEDWRKNVARVASATHAQYLYLPTGMGFVPSEVVEGGFTVANYPPFPINLLDEIHNRQAEQAFFKEKQLYYLLYALVACKVDAQTRGQVLGDIRPSNVFISRKEEVRVGCLHSFPYETSNYAKFVDKIKPCDEVFLAPEDLKSASELKLDSRDNEKSELFSIGATVMSAGILDDLKEIYDGKNKAFRQEEHMRKTTQWLDHPDYSQIFKSIILSLLNPAPEKRISLGDLWAFLQKYQGSIIRKEQFIVNHPPLQFETGVSIIRSKVK